MATTTKPKSTQAKAPKAGIATLDVLAGLAKPAAAKTGGKDYPALDDPTGDIARMADQLATEIEEFKALESSTKLLKAELTTVGRDRHYRANQGKATPTSSVEARGEERTVLVTFQNRYPGSADPAAVALIIGDEAAAEYFYQSFSLKIDGDQIPKDSAAAIIQDIATVLASHDCSEALTANAVIKPDKQYHTARHKFAPEQNLELDKLIPPVAVVRAKK